MSPDKSFFKSFTDTPIPPILYVDTSFIVEALIEGQKYHKESLNFIEALAKDPKNQPILIFSDLLKIELRCAIIANCIRNKYGRKVNIHKILYLHPDLMTEYYLVVEEAAKQLEGVLGRFINWASIPISDVIIKKSGELMPRYRLGSYDAIHVATMEGWDIKDIVAYDWGIEDLPKYKADCKIWTCHGWAGYNDRNAKRRKKEEEIDKLIREAETITKT